MSDKFLGTGGGEGANISNGSADIYANSLRIDNLDPSKAIKTNSTKQLISTNLEISDINNLQQELDNNISNPFVGTLQADDFKGDSIKDKTEASSINLTNTGIDLVANNVLINGVNLENNLTNLNNQQSINTGSINSNTGSINSNTSNISNNQAATINNASNIANNTSTINSNTGSINSNTSSINSNTSSINSNTTAIGNNTTNIANNSGSIGNNTTAIGNNTTNIGNNTTNITANTSDIGSLTNQQGTNTNDISNLNTNVSNNTNDIATNVSEIAVNGVNINSLQNDKYDKTGGPISGEVDLTNNKIVNLANPTNPGDAANKQYVDSSSGNPFDQDLNIADSPTFNGLDLNGTVDMNGNNLLNIGVSGVNTITIINSGTVLNQPTNNNQIANKIYVDNEIQAAKPVYTRFNPTVDTTLFDDGIVRISWIALDLQPSFELLTLPNGQGVFANWVNSNISFNGGGNLIGNNGDNLNSLNSKSFFGVGANADPQFNHIIYGCSSRCELMAENDINYPFYKITVSTGDPGFVGFAVIEKFE